MEIIGDMIGLLIGLMTITFLLRTIYKKVIDIIEQRKKPIQTVRATLISKRMDPRTSVSSKEGVSNFYVIYYLVFKLENGEEIEFLVKLKEYAIILEGNIGKLTFKGNRYIKFYLEKISEDATE